MFSVLQYGYAIIDLENLGPLNVDDLSLSQYLAYILQVCIKLDTLFVGSSRFNSSSFFLFCSLFHKGTGNFVVDLFDCYSITSVAVPARFLLLNDFSVVLETSEMIKLVGQTFVALYAGS